LEGHLSELAIVRLLVNQNAASASFQAAVRAASNFIPPTVNYMGTIFTVTRHKEIELVTTTLHGLEPILPKAFTDDNIPLIQAEITGPGDMKSMASPGWYHDATYAHLSMYVDPEGVLNNGVPYLSCTCTGGGTRTYDLARNFYHAVLSGIKSPTTPF
jgi:hypothetical protein